MSLFGLGKSRSRLGRWIDKRGVSQEDLYKKSGVSKVTITKYCNSDLGKKEINRSTASKILRALKMLTKEEVDFEDFWT